jgi:hypothetical protein
VPESDQRREVIAKVAAYAATRHGGDYARLYREIAGDDGLVGPTELSDLLRAAGVGSALTRGAWVRGVLAALDENRDGRISWQEFLSALGTKES